MLLWLQNVQGGHGLHGTLNFHSKKFVGILNGIDTDVWNPATDNTLAVQFTSSDLEGKNENKEILRRQLGLSSANSRQPLVIFTNDVLVTTFSYQLLSAAWI